jgi:uncharacterized protein YxjI
MKKFYINQKLFKIRDTYYIYDENNMEKFEVKGNFIMEILDKLLFGLISFPYKIIIKNLQNNEEFYLKKNFTFLWKKYSLFINNVKCADVNQNKKMFISNSFTVIRENFDFKLRGNFFSREFDILNHNKVVAHIGKKFLTVNDRYELKIYDDDEYKFYLLIVILIDNCLHKE